MIKYCPTCGRSSETTRFIGEFCDRCTIGKIDSKLKDTITLQECKSCGNIKTSLGYEKRGKESFEKAIYTAMHKSVPACSFELLDFSKGSGIGVIRFRCEVSNENVQFEKELHIKFLKGLCGRCYRIRAGYYEAVVKIRGDSERAERFLEKLSVFLENYGTFISKIDERMEGYDIYIGDKAAVNKFFGSDRKIKRPIMAYEFSGMKNGKKLYRNIYSVRFDDVA